MWLRDSDALEKLDVLNEQIKSVGEKIDKLVIAKLKTGVNAIQAANDMDNLKMRKKMAVQGIRHLHELRQYCTQHVAGAAAKGEVANTQEPLHGVHSLDGRRPSLRSA